MMPLLLNATWLLPALTMVLLMLLPASAHRLQRWASLLTALACLALVLLLGGCWLAEPPPMVDGRMGLAFASRLDWFPALGVQFFTGADGISLLMMAMAAIVGVAGILVSWDMGARNREFFVLTNMLLAGTFGCFISFDLVTFFLFNEVTLIPTYLLIGMFGSGPRERAAMKLNLMLFGASALIILGMCALWVVGGSFDIVELAVSDAIQQDRDFQNWAFPVLFLGFAVLGSIVPFHSLSPTGHAAAPTAISMFLAGVHMKLGGYGCLRVAIYLLPEGAQVWMPVFLVLATFGVVYGAMIAVRQRDLKFLNAFASVSHVGLVTVGFALLTGVGLRGGLLQMLSHGFVTALVFALIGAIYRRTRSRQIDELGGLMARWPFLAVAFLLAGFAVIGVPGSSSFVAELTVFMAGFAVGSPLATVCTAICIGSVVLTAVYVLRAVNGVVAGSDCGRGVEYGDADGPERIAILILLAAIIGFGLLPAGIIAAIDASLQPIVANLER